MSEYEPITDETFPFLGLAAVALIATLCIVFGVGMFSNIAVDSGNEELGVRHFTQLNMWVTIVVLVVLVMLIVIGLKLVEKKFRSS